MLYDELEDEICALLQPLKPAATPNLVEVEPYPELQEDPKKEKFKEARIWVAFAGSDYSKEIRSLGPLSQDEKLQINVTIRTQKRRGDKGVYAYIDKVIKLLLGRKLTKYGSTKLYLLSNNFTAFNERNEWSYTLVFGLDNPVMEVMQTEQSPTFSTLSLNVNTTQV